jgi:hypothetical protein
LGRIPQQQMDCPVFHQKGGSKSHSAALTDRGKAMSKRIHTLIAEHFGQDEAEIKDSEYQYGRFSRRVYVFGGDYYSAGKSKPKDSDGFMTNWKPLVSNYDPSVTIWECKA